MAPKLFTSFLGRGPEEGTSSQAKQGRGLSLSATVLQDGGLKGSQVETVSPVTR